MVRHRFAQMSFASVVLFGVVADPDELMDPELRRVDQLLEDPALVELVACALRKRSPKSSTRGRYGVPAEVALRMLALMHLRDWSYERLEWEVRGNIAYRRFCRIDAERVPDAKTMIRIGRVIDQEALRSIFERITTRVIEERRIAGRRMRVDTTVVESNIRYPTDSGMCADGIRVLSHAIRVLVGTGVKLRKRFVDVARSTSRRVSEISQALRLRGDRAKEAMKKPYRRLLTITKRIARIASEAVAAAPMTITSLRGKMRRSAKRAKERIEILLPRVVQVIRQTKLRVLRGVTNSSGKILSVFDPTARILRRGKLHKPTEFGQLARVQEAECGLVTDIAIEDSHNDNTLLVKSVERHVAVFGRAPTTVAADRGFYSGRGISRAHELGVKHVAVPKPGGRSRKRIEHEQQRWFRRAKAWRTGGEARISRLKHRFGMSRSRFPGASGTLRTATWAAIANNLALVP